MNGIDLQGLLLMGEAIARSLGELDNLSVDNGRRRDQGVIRWRNALTELIESDQKIAADENLSAVGRQNALAAAKARAAPAAATIRSLNSYIAKDLAALTALPPRPKTDTAPEIVERRAEEIRRRRGDSDPLTIRGDALSTSASDAPDMEALYALLDANPTAYPQVAAAFDAPTRQLIAVNLRYRDNPMARRQVDDLVTLRESLTALADDLGRAVGEAGDPIARQAAGLAA